MENLNLTAPQHSLIAALSKASEPMDLSKFDKRVVNGLAKKGLVALESTEQGTNGTLTPAGLVAAASEAPKAKAPRKAKAAKKGKKAKTAKAKKARAPKAEPGFCICGCGDRTLSAKRQFLQGHDARLHSLFLKVARGEEKRSTFPNSEAALAYVQKAPWSTAALRKGFAEAK